MANERWTEIDDLLRQLAVPGDPISGRVEELPDGTLMLYGHIPEKLPTANAMPLRRMYFLKP